MTESEGAKSHRSRGRPRLEDAADIESRLLDGALNEFLKDGYGGTSMNRIIKAVGISKTTLYSRFTSKEELFRAIIQRQMARHALASSFGPSHNRPQLELGLRSYADRALEISLEGAVLELNRLIYSESPRFPELSIAEAEKTCVGMAEVSEFIQRCATADGIPCRDPDMIAEAFILMMRGWYINVMLTNRQVSRSYRQRWVERAVNRLISSRKEW